MLSSVFSVTTQVCFVVCPGALRSLYLVSETEGHQPSSRSESLVIHFDPRGSNGTKGAPYLLGSKVRRFFLVVLPCVTSCSSLATGQVATLIPVVFMLVVKVTVVQVVDVVTVRDGNVAATRTMLVGVVLVDRVPLSGAFVPVVLVLVVKVTVVQVVDVVTVRDGNVAATQTMLVGVILVNDVLSHSAQPSCAFIDAADTFRTLLNSDLNDIHNICKIAGKEIRESLIEN